MARRSVVSEDENSEINLSPMIDCIFILLIFFIVTTVFIEEQGLQVHKPDAAAALALEEVERVVLDITSDNELLLNGNAISAADVVGKLRTVLEPDTPVVIRAHERANHGTFVRTWDAARSAGAKTLTFNTTN